MCVDCYFTAIESDGEFAPAAYDMSKTDALEQHDQAYAEPVVPVFDIDEGSDETACDRCLTAFGAL